MILLLHLAQLAADGMGWRAVLTGEPRPPAGTFVWGRWLAESVNDLLPVMGVGGNVVRARALSGAGVPGPTAGASVVVDMTVIMATQLPVTMLGLCLLVVYFDAGALVGGVFVGTLVPVGMLAGLILAQRRGLFGAGARLIERLVQTPAHLAMASGSAALDPEVHRLYCNRSASSPARVARLGLADGHDRGMARAARPGTPRDLPGSDHVAEPRRDDPHGGLRRAGGPGGAGGSYLVLGTLLGVPPDASLALSLDLRARELIFGIPGLLAWRAGSAAAAVIRGRAATEAE